MTEGWPDEKYFILFDNSESKNLTIEYGIEKMLPGFVIMGIMAWDDLLLLKDGTLYKCPTVPANLAMLKYLINQKYQLNYKQTRN